MQVVDLRALSRSMLFSEKEPWPRVIGENKLLLLPESVEFGCSLYGDQIGYLVSGAYHIARLFTYSVTMVP